jgi:methylmalonyl-CoA mutase
MAKLSLAADFPEVNEKTWQDAARAALRGKPLDSLITCSVDGIAIKPIYGPDHSRHPLVRPVRRKDQLPWDIVQRADIPDIAVANRQMLEDLAGGASGIALVLPGAVTAGAHGVPVSSLNDLERLFEGVELDLISLRLDGGKASRGLVEDLFGLYASRNLDLSRCRLNLGLEPISALAFSNSLDGHKSLVERMGKRLTMSTEHGHSGPVFVADNRVFQGAGASCAQDVAFTIASLVTLMRLLGDAGFPPDKAASHLGVVIGASPDQFAIIAKLRAIRLCWQRCCEEIGIDTPWLPIDVETSLRSMTVHDPYVNMLRAAAAAFGAGLGGADSVTVLPFSAALGLPDRFARRMARNLQVIMQEESGFGHVSDPAAGSGHIEQLTHDLAETGWGIFQKIEGYGGLLDSLLNGYVQSIISDVTARTRRALSTRKIKITGVSEFATLEEPEIALCDIALDEHWQPADSEEFEQPHDCVKCDRLVQSRLSEEFERLRAAAQHHAEQYDDKPCCVFLATLGSPADFSARASWVQNLMAAGGMATGRDETAQTAAEIAKAFKASGCVQACLCSSNEIYQERAGEIAKALKAAGARYVWVAGSPDDAGVGPSEGGADGFMYDGANVLGILQSIHALSGIERFETNSGGSNHG